MHKEGMIIMMARKAERKQTRFFRFCYSCLLRYEITGPFIVAQIGQIKRTPEGALLSTHCGVTEVTI